MEQRELGRSGIAVTRIVLGCGNFGGVGSSPAFFGQGIPKDEARRIMDEAWELGITTFDTADAYGGGRSETWIGEWLAAKGSAVRDAITIETKTFNPMDTGHDRGLARARVLRQLDTSLERLGVERVPLYLAHAFDPDTPLEETLAGFAELVQAGKVGAIGASNFTSEQLAEALEIANREGLPRFEFVQDSFSLLDRADAEAVFSMCRRARARLRGVRAARRRLARRQVPPWRDLPGGVAHDAAAGLVPPLRARRSLRRARGVRAGGAGARRVHGGARDRVAPRSRRPDRGRRRADVRGASRPRSRSALARADAGRARTSGRLVPEPDRSSPSTTSASCSTWSRASRR